MSKKGKGTRGENELLHILYKRGHAVVRAAGSGSNRIESPDLIAGKKGRIYAIEVKTRTESRCYLSHDEVKALHKFATMFGNGCVPYVIVKFKKFGWRVFGWMHKREKNQVAIAREGTILDHWLSMEETR